MNDALRVVEIFQSIQGESTYAGTPCSFIRLAGCNLSCGWCDTRYALDEQGRSLPLALILEAIRPYRSPVVEITGGEPLMQPATPALARMLVNEGYTVLVETNGSLDISVLPYPVVRIMDIKPPSSGMAQHNRFENFVHLRRGDEVKIVIADRMDYDYAVSVIRGPEYPVGVVQTLLSPAQGRVEAAELVGWILDDKLPVRLNLQMHKYIWPNVDRGV